MKKQEYIKRCFYYKGEEKNPYIDKDFGKSFWWKVEYYGLRDHKEIGKLSTTMIAYIREHHWQSISQWDTDYDTAMARAEELYRKGLWDGGSYICQRTRTIEDVERRYNSMHG